MAKYLNARIITKHDKQENWEKAESFIPKLGEIIIYEMEDVKTDSSREVPRIKIGDGDTVINKLPFITDPYRLKDDKKGLSDYNYTITDKNKVDSIPENAKYTDTKYSNGPGIGLKSTTFYNKGVVSVDNNVEENGAFRVGIRTGPNSKDINYTIVKIPGIKSGAYIEIDSLATKEQGERADNSIQNVYTGKEKGTIRIDKYNINTNAIETKSIKVAGLGKLAFLDSIDIPNDSESNTEDLAKLLTGHLADTNNPHRVTWLQLEGKIPTEKLPSPIPTSNLPVLISNITQSSIPGNIIVSKTNGETNEIQTNTLPLIGGTVTGQTLFSNTTNSTSTTTGAVKITGGLGVGGDIYGNKVYGAVYNDYAEYRTSQELIEPGYITYSDDDGFLYKTNKRLQHFEGVVSDTFGFAIGKTNNSSIPLAVAGRVLVYTDEELHAGDVVCAGEYGKAYKMTDQEIKEHPECIVGIVSEIPKYKTWGENNILVNNRIWIKVK